MLLPLMITARHGLIGLQLISASQAPHHREPVAFAAVVDFH